MQAAEFVLPSFFLKDKAKVFVETMSRTLPLYCRCNSPHKSLGKKCTYLGVSCKILQYHYINMNFFFNRGSFFSATELSNCHLFRFLLSFNLKIFYGNYHELSLYLQNVLSNCSGQMNNLLSIPG